MTGISRVVSYEAALIGSADLLILLGLALVLALALALGLKRDPYGEVTRPGVTVLASISPRHLH